MMPEAFDKEINLGDKQLAANFNNNNVFDREQTNVEDFDRNINDLFLETDPNDKEPTGFIGKVSNSTFNDLFTDDF